MWRAVCLLVLCAASVLAQTPVVTSAIPPAAPLATTVTGQLSFANGDSDFGYGPFIDVVAPTNGIDGAAGTATPDGLTFTNFLVFGAAADVTESVFPAGTAPVCVDHPFALDINHDPLQVCGTPGDTFYTIVMPFGSFSSAQPPAAVTFDIDISNLADINAPLDVYFRGGFQFGSDELDNPCCDPTIVNPASTIVSTWDSTSLTPTLFEIEKRGGSVPQGLNYLGSFRMFVDLAPVNIVSMQVTDALPNEISYVGTSISPSGPVPGGGTVTTEPLIGTPIAPGDENLIVDFGPFVGENLQITASYNGDFVDGFGATLIDWSSECGNTFTNQFFVSGVWNPFDPRDGSNVAFGDNAFSNPIGELTTSDLGLSVSGPDPVTSGEFLDYTATYNIGDFSSFETIVATLVLPDGIHLDNGTPFTLTLNSHGAVFTGPISSGNIVPVLDYSGADPLPNTGLSTFTIDVSAALQSDVTPLYVDTVVFGGCSQRGSAPDCGTLNGGATSFSIDFRGITQSDFTDFPTSGSPAPIQAGDKLVATAQVDANSYDSENNVPFVNPCTDNNMAEVEFTTGSLDKTIYAANGALISGALPDPFILSPGDTVTYRLEFPVPSGKWNSLSIGDFFPLPAFDVLELTTLDDSTSPAIPPAGTYKWGPTETARAAAGLPTLTTEQASNKATWTFPAYAPAGNPPPLTVDILVTLTISSKPFAPDLQLTNQGQSTLPSNNNGVFTTDDIVQFQLSQPFLVVSKGVTGSDNAGAALSGPAGSTTTPVSDASYDPPTSSISGFDAGDIVDFSISIQNQGGAGAFDMLIRDLKSPGFTDAFPGFQVDIIRGDGFNFNADKMFLGPSNSDSDLFGNGIRLSDGAGVPACQPATAAPGTNIIFINYQLQVTDPAAIPAALLGNSGGLEEYTGVDESYMGGDEFNHVIFFDAVDFMPTISNELAYPELETEIFSTAQGVGSPTGPWFATIGEVIDVRTIVTIPEGHSPISVLTQTPDSELVFAAQPNPVTLTGGGDISSAPADLATVLANTRASISPNLMIFSLDDVINTNRDDSVDEHLTTEFQVCVDSNVAVQRGDVADITAEWTWDSGNGSPGTIPVVFDSVTIIEPDLDISVVASPTTGLHAGDTVTFTIDIAHSITSDAVAHDVSVIEVVDSIFVIDSVTATGAPSSTSTSPATVTYSSLLLGATQTITVVTHLAVDTPIGATLSHTFNLGYSSLPGTNAKERLYTNTDSDSVTTLPGLCTMSIVNVATDTTEPTTMSAQFVGTDPDLTIGEQVTYTVVATFPPGTAGTFTNLFEFPSTTFTQGTMRFDSHSVPVITGLSAATPAPIATLGDTDLNGLDDTVLLDFGQVDNVNAVDGTIEITFTGTLVDESDNLSSDSDTARNTCTFPTSTEVDLEVTDTVEPDLVVVISVSSPTVEAGNTVTYTITISHSISSTADAFNVDLTNVVPADFNSMANLMYVSGLPATTGPTESPTNTVTASWAQIPLTGTAVISYEVTTDVGVVPNDIITNSVDILWNSIPAGGRDENSTPSYVENDSIDVTVISPIVDVFVLSTTDTDTSGNDVTIGEEVVYHCTVDFPQGTTVMAEVVMQLPNGVDRQSVSQVIPAIVNGGNLVFTPGAPVESDTDGDSNNDLVTFPLGDVVNAPNDGFPTPQDRLTFEVTAVVRDVGQNSAADVQSTLCTLNWSTALSVTDTETTTVVEPNVVVVAACTGPALPDGADAFPVTVSIDNTAGTSPAQNVDIVVDLQDIVYTPGSATTTCASPLTEDVTGLPGQVVFSMASVASSTSCDINFTGAVDALAFWDTDVGVTSAVATYESRSVDPTGETRSYTSAASSCAIRTATPVITTSLVSTSLADTGSVFCLASVDNAIGETTTILITARFPEGRGDVTSLIANMQADTDGLLEVVSGAPSRTGAKVTTSVPGAVSISDLLLFDGLDDEILFNFGTVTVVADNNAQGVDDELEVGVIARTKDVATNAQCDSLDITPSVEWTASSVLGSIFSIDVVEPVLSITETLSGPIDSVVTIQLEVTNDSILGAQADAYSVFIEDVINSSEWVPGTVQPVSVPIGFLFSTAAGPGAGDTTVTIRSDPGAAPPVNSISIDETITIIFEVELQPGLTSITDCSSVPIYMTLPGFFDVEARNEPVVTDCDTLNLPLLSNDKTVLLQTDADGSGTISPGDTLRYSITTVNSGLGTATTVIVIDTPDANGDFQDGSVASSGTITLGNGSGDTSVSVTFPTILASATETVTYDVVIPDPFPPMVTELTNQATVASDQLADILSDDPSTGTPQDPTVATITCQRPVVDLNGAPSGSDATAIFTEAGGPVAIAAPDAIVSDADNTLLIQCTATLDITPDGGAEVLAASDQGVVTSSYAAGVLTINGGAGAPIVDFMTTIQTITYDNTSPNHDPTDRVVTVVCQDDSGCTTDTSLPVTSTITMQAVNDPPVVDNNGGGSGDGFDYTTTWNEAGGAVAVIDPTIGDVTDIDSPNLQRCTFTLATTPDGVAESLSGTPMFGITVSYNSASRVLTLNNLATEAQYTAVMRSVLYDSSSVTPDTSDRLVSVQCVDDSAQPSNVAVSTIQISAVPNPPFVDLNGAPIGEDFSTAFVEDLGPVPAFAPDAVVSDPDSTNLASCVLTLSPIPDGADEGLIGDDLGTGIAVAYNSGSGVMSLGGAAPVGSYELVMRTIDYFNNDQDATEVVRTITVQCTDDTALVSNLPSSMITVTASNDGPTVDLDQSGAGTGFNNVYTEDSAPVSVIDSDVDIVDVDHTDLDSCTVVILNDQDGAAEILAANDFGLGPSVTYTAGTHTLDISGTASLSAYETILASVTYENTEQDPTASPVRQIEVYCTDSDGLDGPSSFSSINVVPVNDPPFVDLDTTTAGEDGAATWTENMGTVPIAPNGDITDVDSANLDVCVVYLPGVAAGEVLSALTGATSISATYDSVLGVLTLLGPDSVANYDSVLQTVTYDYVTENPAFSSRLVEIECRDDSNTATDTSIERTATITLVSENDAPAVDLNGPGVGIDNTETFTEDGPAVPIADPAIAVTDVDSANLQQCVVTIVNPIDGADELLAVDVSGLGVAQAYSPHTLTITGSQPLINYQQALARVTYENTNQNPDTTQRQISVVCTDDEAGNSQPSVVATSFVDVVRQPDPPTIDVDGTSGGTDYSTTYTEDDPAEPIVVSSVVDDVDSLLLDHCDVTLTNPLDGTVLEVLSANAGSTSISISYTGGVLTLTGTDTLANFASVLDTVTYVNNDADPDTSADRVVQFECYDDTMLVSNIAETVITVIASPDAPVLDLNGAGSGIDFSNTFTEDLGPVAAAAPTLQLTDVDSAELSFCEADLTNILDPGFELLSASPLGTAIVPIYDSISGVLSLIGPASPADFQQVLRGLEYENTDQDPDSSADRIINIHCEDETGQSSPNAVSTIMVVPVPDAPVIDLSVSVAGTGFEAEFTEGAPAVAIVGNDLDVTDVDSTILQSCTITLVSAPDGADEVLAVDVSGTSITGAYAAGVFTLTGPDTVDNFIAAMRTTTYENLDEDPDSAPRAVDFQCSDAVSLLPSNVARATVEVVPVNDAPVVDPNGSAAGTTYTETYVEDTPAVVVTAADATIVDSDSTELSECRVTIINILDDGFEELATNVAGTLITPAYDPNTGVLQLNGPDSLANFQAVLREVTYLNNDEDPDDSADRIVSFQCTDDSGEPTDTSTTVFTTITVQPVNDAPVVDLNGDDGPGTNEDTVFVEDGPAVPIGEPDSTVADVDDVNIDNCVITLTNPVDGTAFETLASDVTGTTVTATVGAGVVTLSGPASVLEFQQVIRATTYANSAQDPDTSIRVIQVVCTDPSGDPSNTAISNVQITPSNDPPVVDLNGAAGGTDFSTSFVEDAGAVLITDPTATISDVDSLELSSCRVSLQSAPEGVDELLAANNMGLGVVVTYNANTNVLDLVGTETTANYELILRSVTYENVNQDPTTTARMLDVSCVDDTGLPSNVAVSVISVSGQNDPLVVDLNGPDDGGLGYSTSFTEGDDPVDATDSDLTISDVDTDVLVGCTATLLSVPDGAFELLDAPTLFPGISASYVNPTLTLSGASSVAQYQAVLAAITYENVDEDPETATQRMIEFVCQDDLGDTSASAVSLVDVFPVNDPPVVDLNGPVTFGTDFAADWTEDAGPVAIADISVADVSDVDSTNLQMCTVRITNDQDGADEVLATDVSGTSVTASYIPATHTLVMNGPALESEFQTVLRRLTYDNLGNNPDLTPRNVEIICRDDSATVTDTSNTATATVNIVPVEDPPFIDLNGPAANEDFSSTFSEGDAGAPIGDSVAVVSDLDSDIAFCTATLAATPDGNDESLSVVTAIGSGIFTSYDPVSRSLAIVGNASPAVYSAIVRTATYSNTDEDPDATSRQVTWSCTDVQGLTSNSPVTTVSVIPVNDVPVVEMSATPDEDFIGVFTEDGGPVPGVDESAAAVTDVDSATLDSCSVTLSPILDATFEVLSVLDDQSGSLAITYNSGTGVLDITNTAGAQSPAVFQAALRSLVYENLDDDPDNSVLRNLDFVCVDSQAGTSITDRTNIEIVPVNDPPAVDLDGPGGNADFTAPNWVEGAGPAPIVDTDAILTDSDSVQIDHCTISIVGPVIGDINDVLAANTVGLGITSSYDVGTSTLTLSTPRAVAIYQTALQSLTYDSLDDDPSVTPRTIFVECFDSPEELVSNTAVATIGVTPTNDENEIDLNGPSSPGTDQAVTYTEDEPASVLTDPAANVVDPDSTEFSSCTATLTGIVDFGDETLNAAVAVPGVVVSYSEPTLTMSGVASTGNYETLLRSLTYVNTDQDPTAGDRTVSVTCFDDPQGLAGNTAIVTVTVVPVPDPPVVDLNTAASGFDSNPVTFTEDAGAVLITVDGANVSDIDSAQLASCSLVITNALNNIDEVLSATSVGGVTVFYDVNTQTLSLSGLATVANYNTIIDSVRYENLSENPDASQDRTISLNCVDDTALSAAVVAVATVIVAPENDDPVIDLNGPNLSGVDHTTTFTEDGGPVSAIDDDATLFDIDSQDFQSCTLTLQAFPDGNLEALSAFTQFTSVSESYNPSLGQLTLAGPAPVDQFEAVIRTVTYDNLSDDPEASQRIIDVVCTDDQSGSASAMVTVNVVPVNDPPEVDLNGPGVGANFSTSFTEEGAPTNIGDPATLTTLDVDSTDLSICQAVLMGGSPPDGIDEVLAGSDFGGVTVSYSTLTATLTLSGPASMGDFQSALRMVTYENTHEDPTVGDRTVVVTCLDDDPSPLSSEPVTSTITIIGQNDPIIVDLNGPDAGDGYTSIWTEDEGPVTITDGDASIFDIEDGATVQFCTLVLQNPLDGLTVESLDADRTLNNGVSVGYDVPTATLTLSAQTGGAGLAAFEQVLRSVTYDSAEQDPDTTPRLVSVQCVDPEGVSSSPVSATVTIVPVNDSPVVDANGPLLAGTDYETTFTEKAGPVSVVDNVQTFVSDIDSLNLASCALQLNIIPDGADEILAAATIGNVIPTYIASSGTLVLNGIDSIAIYEQVLRSITYDNLNVDPDTSDRVVTLVCRDDSSDAATEASAPVTSTITIVPVNDAPIVDLSGPTDGVVRDFTTTFTEGGEPQPIGATDLTLTDVDSVEISQCTITMRSIPDGTLESLAASVEGTGIAAVYNSATGTLLLSGVADIDLYEFILGTVVYENLDQDPDTSDRLIDVTCEDELGLPSNVATTTLTVLPENDAPVVDLNGPNEDGADYDEAVWTEDLGPVVIVSDDATVTDVDDLQLDNCVLRIVNDPTLSEFLTGGNLAAFPGTSETYNAVTGELTIQGPALLSDFVSIIQQTTYDNIGEQDPSADDRTIRVVCTDFNGEPSISADSVVTVIPVNDRPIVDLNGPGNGGIDNGPVPFVEDGGPVAVADTTAAVTDVDNSDLISCTISLDAIPNGTFESLAVTTTGSGITASYDDSTGVMTLNGQATRTAYDSVLASLVYNNMDQDPDTSDRTVTITCDDASGDSATQTSLPSVSTITVTPVNDAPSVDLNGDGSGVDDSTVFTEGTGPVPITTDDVTVSDVDSPTLTSCTATLTSMPDGSDESLSILLAPSTVATAFSTATGVLTLSGPASVGDFETALETLEYDNASQDPTVSDRTVVVVCTDDFGDSSAPAQISVEIVPVNDSPVVDLSDPNDSTEDFQTIFVENGAPLPLADPTATITDVDNTFLEGCTVTLTNPADGVLVELLAATAMAGVSTSFNPVTYELTLFGRENISVYQAVLRTVTYQNVDENPSSLEDRIITVQCTDEAGDTQTSDSNVATTTVAVIPQNDPPVLDVSGPNDASPDYTTPIFEEDADPLPIVDVDATLTDPDSTTMSTCTFDLTNGQPGDVLAASTQGTSVVDQYNSMSQTLTLSGISSIEEYLEAMKSVTFFSAEENLSGPARVVTVDCQDDAGMPSNTATITIPVQPVNDPPVVDLDGPVEEGIDYETVFTENGAGVPIASPTSTIEDVDSAQLTVCVITIENPLLGTNETLSAVDQAGITSSYNAGTGVMTLVGPAPVATFESILRTVTYTVLGDDPMETDRIIGVTCRDDDPTNPGESVIATTTITVEEEGDAVVVDLNGSDEPGTGYTTTYTENDGPQPVTDVDLEIRDPDSEELASCTVTLLNPVDGDDEVLSAEDFNGISAFNEQFSHTIFFTNVQEKFFYEIVLRSVRYEHLGENPTAAPDRQIQFQCRDIDGTPGSPSVATIQVVPVNDSPIVDPTGDQQEGIDYCTTFVEGDGPVPIVMKRFLTVTDLDDSNIVSAIATLDVVYDGADETIAVDQASLPSGVTAIYTNGQLTISGPATITEYEAILRTLSYENANADPSETTRFIALTVQDASGTSTDVSEAAQLCVEVIAVNDPPVLDVNPDTNDRDYTTTFTENSAPVSVVGPIDPIFDPDSTEIKNCTIDLQETPDGADEWLEVTVLGNTIVNHYDPETGLLSLVGVAPISQYDSVLRSIVYTNINDSPSMADRIVEIVCYDSAGTESLPSDPVFTTIEVVPVNDPPVPTLGTEGDDHIDNTVVFTEDEGPVALTAPGIIVVTEPDGDQITSCSYTLDDPSAGVLAAGSDAVQNAGLQQSYNVATGVLTISGSATDTTYSRVLETVTFDTDSQNPQGPRNVVLQCTDENGASTPADDQPITYISVVAVADPPIVDLNNPDKPGRDYSTVLDNPEGEPFADIDLTIDDADSVLLSSCSVQMAFPPQEGEGFCFEPTEDTTVQWEWDLATGEVVFYGEASVEEYEEVLQALQYLNLGVTEEGFVQTLNVSCIDETGLQGPSSFATIYMHHNDGFCPVFSSSSDSDDCGCDGDSTSSSSTSHSSTCTSSTSSDDDSDDDDCNDCGASDIPDVIVNIENNIVNSATSSSLALSVALTALTLIML